MEIDVAGMDLNLLVVLDVLLQERNVTRAARRLHRTQSATSHALRRLREHLGDPVLVRVGGAMRPTPKAERIAGEVSRLLRTIGRVLAEEGAFDPATTDRVFTLAGPDFAVGLVPTVLVRVAARMPLAGCEFVAAAAGMLQSVADGRVDLAIGPSSMLSVDGLLGAPLFALDWVVYAREGHPAIGVWGAKAWASHPHLRVRIGAGVEGPVDQAARARGLTRRVGVWLPSFLMAPPILAETDLLFTAPRAVLAGVAQRFGLVALPCPLKLAPVAHALFWSTRLDRDPAITLFREMVLGASQEVFGAGDRGAPSASRPRR